MTIIRPAIIVHVDAVAFINTPEVLEHRRTFTVVVIVNILNALTIGFAYLAIASIDDSCQMTAINFDIKTAFIVYGWFLIGVGIYSIICILLIPCDISWICHKVVLILCFCFDFSWFVVMAVLLFDSDDCDKLYDLAELLFIFKCIIYYFIGCTYILRNIIDEDE